MKLVPAIFIASGQKWILSFFFRTYNRKKTKMQQTKMWNVSDSMKRCNNIITAMHIIFFQWNTVAFHFFSFVYTTGRSRNTYNWSELVNISTLTWLQLLENAMAQFLYSHLILVWYLWKQQENIIVPYVPLQISLGNLSFFIRLY